MQNNEILQINAIFKKNCFRTLKCAHAGRSVAGAWKGPLCLIVLVLKWSKMLDKNLCALSTQPIGTFLSRLQFRIVIKIKN